jgi:hypothetical protein
MTPSPIQITDNVTAASTGWIEWKSIWDGQRPGVLTANDICEAGTARAVIGCERRRKNQGAESNTANFRASLERKFP